MKNIIIRRILTFFVLILFLSCDLDYSSGEWSYPQYISDPFYSTYVHKLIGWDPQTNTYSVFLGVMNREYDINYILYESGPYGKVGGSGLPHSIWNQYLIDGYGSSYSDYSPWNPYISSSSLGGQPPIILDEMGNFYGYFTTNPYYYNRTTVPFYLEILSRPPW